jgi:hypothetical protein
VIFVLFKQGGHAPFVLHFANICLAAFVFHVYKSIGLGEDFDLAIRLLDNLPFAFFGPLFLHFCLRYPVRSEGFRPLALENLSALRSGGPFRSPSSSFDNSQLLPASSLLRIGFRRSRQRFDCSPPFIRRIFTISLFRRRRRGRFDPPLLAQPSDDRPPASEMGDVGNDRRDSPIVAFKLPSAFSICPKTDTARR